MKSHWSLKVSKISRTSFFVVLFFTLNALAVYFAFSTYYEKELRKTLYNQSKMISALLDLQRIKNLEGNDGDLNKPDYHFIKNQFSEIKKQFKEIQFVYLLGKKNDGGIFFYLDNVLDNTEEMSPPGQLYDEATDGLKKVFLNRKGDVEGPFGDRWGEFISAYYPILDGKGENVVAVLGVDVTSDVWTDLKKHKTRVAFFVALVSLAMMSLAVFGLQKFFKKSEHLKDLQEKDERIFQIAEHSRSIFWETNTHGVFTYMSPTWKTLLGYEESDFLNKKNFYELDLFEHNPDVSSQLRLCFEKRESVKNLVKTVRAKNGDLLKFNTYTFPFYSPQGEYLGYRGIDTDVTLKVQAEQIKNDLQKEFYNSAKHTSVETLAAGISHEINNPWPSFMALFPY